MDFSELTYSGKQNGTAHLGWNGAGLLDADLSPEELEAISAALPCPPRDVPAFVASVVWVAQRFRQSLRQTEFGPNRRDQKAMLKVQLEKIEDLKQRLSALDVETASELSEEVYRGLLGKTNIDFDAIIEVIRDANLLRHSTAVSELQDICCFFEGIDTNTSSLISLYEGGKRINLPPSDEFSLKTVLGWLDRIAAGRRELMQRQGHGPEPLWSLQFAVFLLANIYKAETDEPVTSFDGAEYTGRSASPAGKFILTAVERFLPPRECFPDRILESINDGSRILIDRRHLLPRRVAEFIREYIAQVERPATRGRKKLEKPRQ
jgi:hypothetical protein